MGPWLAEDMGVAPARATATTSSPALVRQRAEEAGLTISDYVASVLARAHGVPEADLLTCDRDQEVLPLGKTA